MKFNLDINNSDTCFIRDISRIFAEENYLFSPNNKKIYMIDTERKQCIGVDSIDKSLAIYTHATSFSLLKRIIKNKGVKI